LVEQSDVGVTYKTVVISGGEGYEEYKNSIVSTIPIGSIGSSSSQDRSQHASFDLPCQSTSNAASGSSNLSPASACSIGTNLQPHAVSTSSVIAEDSLVGKDDLINYVLTWDI